MAARRTVKTRTKHKKWPVLLYSAMRISSPFNPLSSPVIPFQCNRLGTKRLQSHTHQRFSTAIICFHFFYLMFHSVFPCMLLFGKLCSVLLSPLRENLHVPVSQSSAGNCNPAPSHGKTSTSCASIVVCSALSWLLCSRYSFQVTRVCLLMSPINTVWGKHREFAGCP